MAPNPTPRPEDLHGPDPRPDPHPRVLTVEQTIDLDADLDAVWQALTRRDALVAWLGDAPDLEMRPGAAGRLHDRDGATRDILVTEVDGPHRLTWHWWHEDGPLTTVEITTTRTETGTRVRVVETLDPEVTRASANARSGGKIAHRDATAAEWTVRLDRLRISAAVPAALVALG